MALPTKSDVLRLDTTFLGQPFCDVEAKSLNSIRLDITHLGQPFVGLGVSLTPIRALLLSSGVIQQIQDAEVGTGKKPLVLLNGEIKQRSTSEGLPVVISNGAVRTLLSTESLII